MPPTPTKASLTTQINAAQQALNAKTSPAAGLATSATPASIPSPTVQTSPTPFRINTPDTINPATLQNAPGRTEVFAARDQMQAQADQRNQLSTDYTNLTKRINSPLSASPFQNPQAFIEETLLRRPTQTQDSLTERSNAQATGYRNLATDVQDTRQQVSDDLGVIDLQANLAETRNRIADRTVQLRTALRDFETNAERRGVAREFVDSEKNKVQADAAAELADLAIIESAQAGNLEMAQQDIDRAVGAKIQAFEFENAAIESEIKRLEAIDTKESQARSEQLQIALGERTRLIEQSVADEKQRLQFLSEAAANGADQGTLLAIQKSATPGEAALLAGPFIGRLDRQAKQANIAQSYASANASRLQAQKTQAEINAINSTATGGSNIAVQAFDSFAGTLNENNREQYTKALAGAVSRGNVDQTEIALKNAAQAAAGSALREDVIKRDQAIGALKKVQKEIAAYEKAGGNTSLLTGGYEDLQNKLGKTSDPKLAEIETRINLALNAYTNAVSGASFTPQESARYASLFPSTSNTNQLNATKIDTLVDSFEGNNQVFYGNFYGGYTPSQLAEQAVYEELVANASFEQLKELGITQ